MGDSEGWRGSLTVWLFLKRFRISVKGIVILLPLASCVWGVDDPLFERKPTDVDSWDQWLAIPEATMPEIPCFETAWAYFQIALLRAEVAAEHGNHEAAARHRQNALAYGEAARKFYYEEHNFEDLRKKYPPPERREPDIERGNFKNHIDLPTK